MTENAAQPLQYGVDRLVINGRRVFSWGWAAHRERAVKAVDLHVEGDGWQCRLPAGIGLSRPDVEKAYPDLVEASACGFVITGYMPHEGARKLVFEATLEDGTPLRFDATGSAETRYAERRRRSQLRYLVRAVWRRLRRGDIAGIVRRAKAQSYGAPTLDDESIVRSLVPLLRGHGATCLMFDHSMGGGANQYREAAIAQRVAAGEAVLLCTYNLPMLEYRLHVHRAGESPKVFRISSFLTLERVVEQAPVKELFLNSPVSFDEPLVLADWLATLRRERPSLRLTITVHDYLSICPSFVLLDADGRYCGIPDVSQCAICLKRHGASYVSLSPPTQIGPWRALWRKCLEAADEVRCFSESSRDHLARAYPGLAGERITVIPHKLDFAPERWPTLDHRAPLVIGIVGEISEQKGARLVKELVARIDREHPDVRVVVIGTLHAVHKSPRLAVTGPYRREDLVNLVESHGINMFLFPSIWPETFSYVVAALMALGAPIVAFDLGAPAERLQAYPRARLCREVSAEAALAALVDFHRQLGVEPAAAA